MTSDRDDVALSEWERLRVTISTTPTLSPGKGAGMRRRSLNHESESRVWGTSEQPVKLPSFGGAGGGAGC